MSFTFCGTAASLARVSRDLIPLDISLNVFAREGGGSEDGGYCTRG